MFSEQLEPRPWFKVMGPGHARPRSRDAWGHVATISLFTLTSNKMFSAKLVPRTDEVDTRFGEKDNFEEIKNPLKFVKLRQNSSTIFYCSEVIYKDKEV